MQRLFLAVRPDATVVKELLARQEELRAQLPVPPSSARWLLPESLHLTLHFLGDVPAERIAPLGALLERLRPPSRPPSWIPPRQPLDHYFAFPDPHRARVAGLGGRPPVPPLASLHADLRRLLESAGFSQEDRAYYPHVTFVRFRAAIAAVAVPPAAALDLPVAAVTLYRSHRDAAGSRYEILGEYPC